MQGWPHVLQIQWIQQVRVQIADETRMHAVTHACAERACTSSYAPLQAVERWYCRRQLSWGNDRNTLAPVSLHRMPAWSVLMLTEQQYGSSCVCPAACWAMCPVAEPSARQGCSDQGSTGRPGRSAHQTLRRPTNAPHTQRHCDPTCSSLAAHELMWGRLQQLADLTASFLLLDAA